MRMISDLVNNIGDDRISEVHCPIRHCVFKHEGWFGDLREPSSWPFVLLAPAAKNCKRERSIPGARLGVLPVEPNRSFQDRQPRKSNLNSNQALADSPLKKTETFERNEPHPQADGRRSRKKKT